MTPPGRMRLLQMTDLHLHDDPDGALAGMRTLASFGAVLAHARRYRWAPDALVLSGDLANDGTAPAYRGLGEMLAALGVPVYCLPGNHDDPHLMRELLARAGVDAGDGFDLGAWQVALLDTHVPGTHGGHLHAGELARLEARLARRPHAPALVFLHHPPVSIASPWMDAMGLDNAGALFEVLARHRRVRALACGHVHQVFETRRGAIAVYTTPSTCVQFAPRAVRYARDARPPGYRWFELFADGAYATGVEWVAP